MPSFVSVFVNENHTALHLTAVNQTPFCLVRINGHMLSHLSILSSLLALRYHYLSQSVSVLGITLDSMLSLNKHTVCWLLQQLVQPYKLWYTN